jgi:inosose dehydratase
MNKTWNRRQFTAALGLGLVGAIQTPAAPRRKLKIGHTGITWGYRPENAEQAIKDVSSLGFHGYESFGSVLEAWESKGGLDVLLKQANLPLISAYCDTNLTDPAKRKDEIDKVVRWGKLIRKCGGSVAVIGPNGVKRSAYDFAASKANIVAQLNDVAKALMDIGLVGVLHQHTGTCVEVRDEVYAVMEAVDTRYVKFGPDVGQLKKGGSDPVKIVKDFLPVIHHVHFKDFSGGPNWEGYCPLGQGQVDLPAVLALLESSKHLKIIMTELDWSRNPPLAPLDAARANRDYLASQGYKFRA